MAVRTASESSGCSARRRRASAQNTRLNSAPSAATNDGTNVTMTTPPVRPTSSRTSSGTFLGTSHRARAEEWEKITGAALTSIAWRIVSSEVWLRSTSQPHRFTSRTTSCSNVMVTARSAGTSEGTYTDQNWPPTPPAAMRGRSVMRVGSAGSRPCRSSHSRSLWPSISGAARRRSSTAVGCYRASPIDRQPDPERSWLRDSHPGTRKDFALFPSYVKRGPDVRVDTSPRGELERLYRSQRGRMWQALFAFAGDPEEASDVVAEAFAQALRRGDAFRSPERRLWRTVFRIAAGEMKALARDLVAALAKLSEKQRAAVVLHHVAGYPAKEIAQIIGSTTPAVHV